MTPTASAPLPSGRRDPRIDVFRGIALVMIFVDHLPDNFYAFYMLWNFGWSDAAEGFVLMAGMSAGLAYGAYFRRPMRFWSGLTRVWRRAWTIYLVHILVTVGGMAATAAVALWFANPALMEMNQIGYVLGDPTAFLFRMPLLMQFLDYADILPMYLALVFAAPVALILAWRWPWALLAGSVALWLLTAITQIDLPSFTREFGWFFNPLSWQLIFTIGILTGVALKDGRRLVPVRRWLQLLAGAIILAGIAAMRWPEVTEALRMQVWRMGRAGWPDYVIGVEKTFLPLPRLLHALALAYLLSSFDVVRQFSTTVWMAPFAVMGKQSLPVFALGSVLTFAMQAIRAQTGISLWQDTLLLAIGISAMFTLAAARQFWPKDPPLTPVQQGVTVPPNG